MRVLYVSDYNVNPGGAGTALDNQMEAVRRLGHTVEVVYDHIPERAKLFRPDLIHFHTVIVNVGLGVLQWAQYHGIAHCLTLHDFWPFCGNRMHLRSISDEAAGVECPACDGQCDRGRAHPTILATVNGTPTIAFQEFQAARLRTNGVRVDGIIPHGLDTEFWHVPTVRPDVPRVFSSSAWFDCHWKGGALIDRAFKGTDVEVYKIRDVPRWALRDALQTGHVFLFPSTYPETWGLALLEAMSCGLACVASAVDGPRCMIEDGVDGLLVPPRDEAALREATLSLVKDKRRRERLGRNAAEKVRANFTLAHYGRDIMAFYERLLDGR